MRRALLPLSLTVLIAACAEPAKPKPVVAPPSASAKIEPEERYCALSGVIRSAQKTPVKGALLAVNPAGGDPAAVVKTDEKGRYCVEELPAGEYGFTITTRDQTAIYIDMRSFTPEDEMDARVGVSPGFVLRGRATDEKGAPLVKAKLFIPRFSDYLADLFVAETGADGRYEVKLPTGRYAVSVHSDRHVSSQVVVDVTADNTLDLSATRLHPEGTLAPQEVVEWIRSHAVPLKTPSAGQGLDDMVPLQAMIGGAQIVALGEATHGTREFFQLKHRMLEMLVEKMGFRSFGIEASFADCLPLSEYVSTGKGDPAAALANQRFWTWDTEEVLEMVRWMRRYNEDPAHKDKLSFWGFDMQFPAASVNAVLSYLHAFDPALEKLVTPALEPIDDDFSARQVKSLSDVTLAALESAVRRINSRLREEAAKKKASDVGVRIAQIHGRILLDYLISAASGDGAARDRSMADIASQLLEIESVRAGKSGPAKMVLWAHNGHISKSDNGGVPSMGSYLAKRFGDKYVAFGFAFDEGSFQAVDLGPKDRGLVPFSVPSAPLGSLDHTLARAGVPLFALSLKDAEGAALDWLNAASVTRSIGSAYGAHLPRYGLFAIQPRAHFDALLFVQKTTAARPNETGKRGGTEPKKPPPPKLADPGFEDAKAGEMPEAFRVSASPKQLVYKATVTDKGCAAGKQCLVIAREKGDVPIGIGTVASHIDATPYRGQTIDVRAMVRATGKAPGDEAFFFVSAPPAKAAEEKLVSAEVRSSSWSRASVTVEVPADADEIVIALVVTGAASAGLDEIEVAPK